MKTKMLSVLCVCAALATAAAGVLAADPPAPRTTGRVLILLNGRIVEGAIERQGDQYRVRRAIGETWLPADQVLCLCADMVEAYGYLRARANLFDPDERLRLAKWCQLEGLRPQALAEVTAAVQLRPEHAESLRLLHHLQSCSAPSAAVPAPGHDKPDPVADLPRVEVDAELLGLFVTRVQPILMNTCAHCHATDKAGTFKLVRAYPANQATYRTTQLNLAAVLAEIQRGSPPGNLLLTRAVSVHGGAEQAPLKSRQTPAYRTLEEWVRMAAASVGPVENPSPSPLPRSEAATVAQNPPAQGETSPAGSGERPEAKTQKPKTDGEWAVAHEEAKAGRSSLVRPSASTPEVAAPDTVQGAAVPLDPYDPLLFNAQLHPSAGSGN